MLESVEFSKLGRLERYRIAQRFHELIASGLEHSIAAAQISIRHGVSDGDVIASAAEFKREPFWRL
jgi:hypothetical protein